MGNPHFQPVCLQVVLGAVARDTVILPQGHFYSTASGRPRAPPKGVTPFRGRPRVPFLFCREGISGNARIDLGILHFCGFRIFGVSQGRPRVTDGFASRGIFGVSQGWTSGLRRIWVSPIFGVSQGWTSGYWRICLKGIFVTLQGGHRSGAKRQTLFWHRLQTDLGGHIFRIPDFETPLQTPFRISLCIGATG